MEISKIDFENAEWLIVGWHEDLGLGILSYHRSYDEAEKFMEKIKDGLHEGEVVAKIDMLMGE